MIAALILYMTLQLPLFSSVNFSEPQDKFSILKKKTESYFATLPSNIREDSALLVPDLIRKYGYPCETHTALYNILNTYEFLSRNEFLVQLGGTLCNDNYTFQILSTNAIFAICGFNEKQMNSSLLPIIMGHTLSGASTKQIYHCVQGVKSGKFQR
ncbi:hypothetical protein ILUMI_03042 [Ignelater luminosus]|uniref:Uncharacterized protein n=1 Tax=Ignelater luminosus TaxID=2038154 RepID=A0A8K0DBI6_IGNLU|nr:hypothetical protein ILUMI_03042 [Ignelater luminosus]